MSELLNFTIPEKPVDVDKKPEQVFIERIKRFQKAELKVGIQKKVNWRTLQLSL